MLIWTKFAGGTIVHLLRGSKSLGWTEASLESDDTFLVTIELLCLLSSSNTLMPASIHLVLESNSPRCRRRHGCMALFAESSNNIVSLLSNETSEWYLESTVSEKSDNVEKNCNQKSEEDGTNYCSHQIDGINRNLHNAPTWYQRMTKVSHTDSTETLVAGTWYDEGLISHTNQYTWTRPQVIADGFGVIDVCNRTSLSSNPQSWASLMYSHANLQRRKLLSAVTLGIGFFINGLKMIVHKHST